MMSHIAAPRKPHNPVIICDVDNCIADDAWRLDFVDWNVKDLNERFHDYHRASPLDAIANREYVDGEHVVFVTAMPERYAPLRIWWLRLHGFPAPFVLFRKDDDYRPSAVIKRDAARRIMAHNQIAAAYDDRQDVIDAYISLGIPAKRVWIHDGEWPHDDNPGNP